MTMMAFLNTHESDDPLESDFINDAKSDSRFPDAKSWDELESYLHRRGACYQAVEAGEQLWKKYEASMKSDLLV